MNGADYGMGWLMLLSAAGLAVAAAPAQAASSAKVFKLPSGPARATVPLFMKQSGVEILASSDDLERVVTRPVSGRLRPEQALDRMLSGTELGYRVKPSGVIVVFRRAVAVPEATDATHSDDVSSAVIITGFRRSYADSVRMKLATAAVSDSLSSDGLGRFPDLNVGEAVQRITGVQINREAESRNATINLRGLPGTFARTTINGQAFAEPLLDSSTPLGAFNSDIFSAVSVIKTPSAIHPSGGLSGILDLRIQAAEARRPGGSAKISYEYNELGALTSPAFSVSYNLKPTRDLAAFAVLAFKEERFRRDSINISQYTPLDGTTPDFQSAYAAYYAPYQPDGSCLEGEICHALGSGTAGRGGVLFPSDIRQIVRYNEGRLFSAAGGLSYRLTDRWTGRVSGFLSRRALDRNAMNMIEVDLRPVGSMVAPSVAPFQASDGAVYVDSFDFTAPQVNVSARSEPALQETWSVNGEAEWTGNLWQVNATAVTSQAHNHLEQTQIDWRTAARANNGLAGRVASGGTDIDRYALVLNTRNIGVSPGPWTWAGPANPPFQQNTAGDQIVVAGSSGYANNRLSALELTANRSFQETWLASVSGGVRMEATRFTSRGYRTSAKGVQTAEIGLQFLIHEARPDFFGGSASGKLTEEVRVNYDYAIGLLRPVAVEAGDVLTDTGWINDPSNASFSANNFSIAYQTASAFVQADSQAHLFGIPVRTLLGMRFEETEKVTTTLNRQNDQAGVPSYGVARFQTRYRQWLPSLLITGDLRDDIRLRVAAYKTYAQPQPRNLSPATTVTANSLGYHIAYGGHDLRPYTADSLDASLEWYNRPGSLVSLAVYRKRVNDLVGPETRLERLCPADATAFGLGHLHVEAQTCLSDMMINGRPAIITATGNFNNDNPITIDGVEFSVQQTFDFLPGAWRHLGGLVNASYTRVSGRNADGTLPVLPGVSEEAFNLIVYYETPKWGARIVYNYRDEYVLAGTNTFTGGMSRVKRRGQVDASFSCNLTARYSLSIDAFNLGNARRTQYQWDERLPRANDYDGRTFTLGLRAVF